MAEKIADYGSGDAFPGEEPQAVADREQLRHDYTVDQVVREPDSYNWSMSGTHVSVSDDDHGTQFDAMAWTDFNRPFAYGHVELHYNWTAIWHINYTNMSIPLVERRLKRYTRDQGWDWGGITDSKGEPLDSIKTSAVDPEQQWISDKLKQGSIYRSIYLSPEGLQHLRSEGGRLGIYWTLDKAMGFSFGGRSLYDERFTLPDRETSVPVTLEAQVDDSAVDWGSTLLAWHNSSEMEVALKPGAPVRLISINGEPVNLTKTAAVPGIGEINPGVKDWRINEWQGTGQYDSPGDNQSDTPFYGFEDEDYSEDMPLNVPRTCSECGELTLNYNDWRNHILREHLNPERKPPADPQPVVDLDDVLPANFNEAIMDKTVQRQSRLIHQLTAEKPRNFIREAEARVMWHVAPSVRRASIAQNGLQFGHEQNWPTFSQGIYLFNDLDTARDWPYEMGGLSDQYDRGPYDLWQVDTSGLTLYPDEDLILQGLAWYTPDPIGSDRVRLIHTFEGARGPEEGWPPTDHKLGSSQPQIPGPMPFIYDIEQDRIYVGHPGERHSDIKGRFTPGGVIEGLYDPKGNVQIRTDTDMPYTVRHMAQLWYAMHPELQMKAIYLMVGDRKYKLASANIGHQVRNLVATDPAAWAVFQALEPLGNVYAVGGIVRDVVLGKTPKDVDLMVQGVDADDLERALKRLPGRVDFTGKQFGVFRYRDRDGNEVEVALPRTERSTGPGHRDFEVVTSPYISVGEDLARRDFTGNAMAVNLATGDLIDPYHGSEDLKSGALRAVSDRSFIEDPLRILRAFGSVSRHGLDPAPETYHDLAAHGLLLSELPKERLQAELDKLMAGDDPAKAIDLMEATGVLQHVLPDVAATTGFDQKSKYHALLLSEHLKEVLRRVASQTGDVDLRWAALLHDIGKPSSQWIDEHGYGHYYENEFGQGSDHDVRGAEMAQKLLTDLKFPTDRIQQITHLIRHHMFPSFSSQGGARKFINRVGDEHVDDLLTLRDADSGGKGLLHDGNVPLMRQYVQSVREAGEPTSQSMLAINGNDLIQAGFTPGPDMGRLLRWLTEQVIEDPSLNDRETLLQMAGVPEESVKFSGNFTYPLPTREGKLANILDEIHDTLDPDVFNHAESIDPQVKPKIVEWVKKKVYKTMTDAGWPDPSKYLSMVLTGSLTTYQWGEQSDFDISLWVDVEHFPEYVRADLIALMIEKCDGIIVPGTTHVLQDFVVDSNRYTREDLYKPGLRSAYDLDEQKWIVLPEKTRSVDIAKRWPEHLRYAHDVVDKLKLMIRYDKYAVKTYWDMIHRQRFLDMRAGKGDLSLSNIVYKMVANEGLFPIISEITGEHIA